MNEIELAFWSSIIIANIYFANHNPVIGWLWLVIAIVLLFIK